MVNLCGGAALIRFKWRKASRWVMDADGLAAKWTKKRHRSAADLSGRKREKVGVQSVRTILKLRRSPIKWNEQWPELWLMLTECQMCRCLRAARNWAQFLSKSIIVRLQTWPFVRLANYGGQCKRAKCTRRRTSCEAKQGIKSTRIEQGKSVKLAMLL